jgi:hypothetical protein
MRVAARSGSVSSPRPATSPSPSCPGSGRIATATRNGKYRWYNDYQLPDRYEHQRITVRLHANPQDAARKFNRTENVRPIPPADPDLARLYPRRNDSESMNRNLEDTLWIGRAHSVGHARQLLNLLGYPLMVNGLALRRHQRHRTKLAA